MREPDVTLTDYGLTLECALLAILLGRLKDRNAIMKRAGVGFFTFMGLSAAFGGTVHGFCPEMTSTACRVLWQLTLQAIGLSAFSMWILGASLVARSGAGQLLGGLGLPALMLYGGAVYGFTQDFWIAFTIYLPAAILLLAGFWVSARRDLRSARIGAIGSLLSFLSSGIQLAKVGLHPAYFNHNALAHVVQGIALWLMFRGIAGLSRRAPTDETRTVVLEVPSP